MASSSARTRREVARFAQQYLDGAISFERFFELVPEQPDDEHIAELLDLIEHEPKRGGFLGASAAEHDSHMGRIRELIQVLTAAEAPSA